MQYGPALESTGQFPPRGPLLGNLKWRGLGPVPIALKLGLELADEGTPTVQGARLRVPAGNGSLKIDRAEEADAAVDERHPGVHLRQGVRRWCLVDHPSNSL